jgi:hypothetical protein
LPTLKELKDVEEVFKEKRDLKSHNKRNPLRYKAKYNSSDFNIFNLAVFTSNATLYQSNEFKKPISGYIAFRCICEIKSF